MGHHVSTVYVFNIATFKTLSGLVTIIGWWGITDCIQIKSISN